MCNHYDVEADYCIASTQTLCREANATIEEVERAKRALVKLGEWSKISINGQEVMRMHMQCPIDCDRSFMHRTKEGFEAFHPYRIAA